jgi:uncharacterized protein (DUF427 family)
MKPLIHDSRLLQAARTVTSKTAGSLKTESSPRRIRILLAGAYIFDSTHTILVWEHPYFPQYYFPSSALTNVNLGPPLSVPADEDAPYTFSVHDLIRDSQPPVREAIAQIHSGPYRGYSRLEMAFMDGYFEEDEPMPTKGHPFDPYKRIDCRRSSRQIRVEVDGVEVANAPWAVHLYETSLPVRYYVPRTSVNWSVLKESNTTTFCPYKGTSRYWSVDLGGGKGGRDLVWGYETTPVAVGEIQGLMCFYNEKVDTWVGGEKEERPKSKFA